MKILRVPTGYRRSMTEPETPPPGDPEVIRAAGGIVLRAGDSGGWQVAVVHRPEHLDWTLPKGKLELGETAIECALREVREETGFSCDLGRFAGEVEYTDRRGRVKVVSYWLMQPVDGAFGPTSEVDELVWPSLADAAALLSYPHDRELLESVSTPLAKGDD